MAKKQFWLMKSEPETYSIDQLAKDKSTLWEGVRNYQARNFMTQDMKVGDKVLFYHSNATPPGVAGLAEVSKSAVPDPSAFDSKSPYYDEKSTADKPRWFCVEVRFKEKFPQLVSLEAIRAEMTLANMLLIRKGQRLSIQPITENEYKTICRMGTACQTERAH